MNHLSIYKTGTVVAILTVLFYILCMFWGLLLVDPVLKELHLNLLRIAFPGFGFSAIGMIAGLIEAYLYGLFFGGLFAWLCRKACVSKK